VQPSRGLSSVRSVSGPSTGTWCRRRGSLLSASLRRASFGRLAGPRAAASGHVTVHAHRICASRSPSGVFPNEAVSRGVPSARSSRRFPAGPRYQACHYTVRARCSPRSAAPIRSVRPVCGQFTRGLSSFCVLRARCARDLSVVEHRLLAFARLIRFATFDSGVVEHAASRGSHALQRSQSSSYWQAGVACGSPHRRPPSLVSAILSLRSSSSSEIPAYSRRSAPYPRLASCASRALSLCARAAGCGARLSLRSVPS